MIGSLLIVAALAGSPTAFPAVPPSTAAALAAPQDQDPASGAAGLRPTGHRGSLLVEARRIHVSADTLIENSAVLIRNGKVLYVGDEIPAEAREGATVVRFEGGTVVPGWINPHTHLGQADHLAERIDAFTPELQASDAFDPFAAALSRYAANGITVAGFAPTSFNAFSGQAAAVRTGRVGQVIADSTYLKMSMIDAAFDQNRFPTSRMGAAELIRRAFQAARNPMGSFAGRERFLNEVATGHRPLAIHVQTRAEIDAVLDLCEELQLAPLLLGCDRGHECAERLAKTARGVVLAPLGFDAELERLRLPARLERLGVKFSFMAERPADLRLSAALAVRHGTSTKAALRALTQTAAEHADVAEQVGTLHEGKSADFCVFEGNPLDLTHRLLAVYLAGVRHDATAETR